MDQIRVFLPYLPSGLWVSYLPLGLWILSYLPSGLRVSYLPSGLWALCYLLLKFPWIVFDLGITFEFDC